jgi:hypothetical protein
LRLGGKRTWWLPDRLARVLPVFDIGSERRSLDRPDSPDERTPAPTSLPAVAAVQ